MKNCIKTFIIFLALLIGNIIYAQSKIDSISAFHLTITPSSVLNLYGGVQAGIEIGINKFGLIETEATIFYRSMISEDNTIKSGHRLAANYKLPFSNKMRLIWIFSFQYRKSTQDLSAQFSRLGDTFFERITYEQQRKMLALFIGMGTNLKLNNFIKVEFAVSTGLGGIRTNNIGLPNDAIRIRDNFRIDDRFFDEGTFRTPLVVVVAKFKFGK